MSTLLVLFILGLPGALAFTGVITEDFSQIEAEGATLVLNKHFQALHPTLEAIAFGDGTQTQAIDVGSAQLGSFTEATYAQFSQGGDLSGQIIHLDTDQYPSLEVTNFHLQEGWVLEPVGSQPLVILSHGDIVIDGFINCSGRPGEAAQGGLGGHGGEGRCGGGHGGAGGDVGQSGENGQSPSAVISGGRGGHFDGGVNGGGGGGSWNGSSAPGSGHNASGAGGQAGVSESDPSFINLQGAAGGGGGAGTATQGGGGGGAAGGLVVLTAVGDIRIGSLGAIYVNGGTGGDADEAGAGGGGAGGSVRAFSGAQIQILNPDGDGAIRANPGSGGQNNVGSSVANGGTGRNWFAAVDIDFVGFYTPTEEIIFSPGDVSYGSEPQELITPAYDLRSTRWQLESFELFPDSQDYQWSLSTSPDGSTWSDWTQASLVSQQNRFVRFRLVVTNTQGSEPDFLESLQMNYSAQNVNPFDFEAAGCGRIDGSQRTGPKGLSLLLPFLVIFFLKLKTQKQTTLVA